MGFCGGGGTPLFSANEIDFEVAWFAPQSEYRPTEYLQRWVRFWFDEGSRLEAAKRFQLARLDQIRKRWISYRPFQTSRFQIDANALRAVLSDSEAAVQSAVDNSFLLTEEARLTKVLYKMAARAAKYGEFSRAKKGAGTDPANRFLDHGNYLAYGLGATATWVLGLPHGLAIMHGKTRRGGLVFDVADLVKDSLILPQAFISAARGDEEQEFRVSCLENLTRAEALDFMIDVLKETACSVESSNG